MQLKALLPVITLTVITSYRSFGQQPADSPSFEAASIKPGTPNSLHPTFSRLQGGPGTDDPGRITYTNVPLNLVLANAYGVRTFQLDGPKWLDSRYDILAKLPPGATREQLNVMLRNLLAERFRLTLHHEERELPIYILSAARGGPKLRVSAVPPPSGSPSQPPPGQEAAGFKLTPEGFPALGPDGTGQRTLVINGVLRMNCGRQPVATLTDYLISLLNRSIVDKTGLNAKYDFTLAFALNPNASAAPPTPDPTLERPDNPWDVTVFTALQQQLGLKLEPAKGPVGILVIDHLEKVPIEN